MEGFQSFPQPSPGSALAVLGHNEVKEVVYGQVTVSLSQKSALATDSKEFVTSQAWKDGKPFPRCLVKQKLHLKTAPHISLNCWNELQINYEKTLEHHQ